MENIDDFLKRTKKEQDLLLCSDGWGNALFMSSRRRFPETPYQSWREICLIGEIRISLYRNYFNMYSKEDFPLGILRETLLSAQRAWDMAKKLPPAVVKSFSLEMAWLMKVMFLYFDLDENGSDQQKRFWAEYSEMMHKRVPEGNVFRQAFMLWSERKYDDARKLGDLFIEERFRDEMKTPQKSWEIASSKLYVWEWIDKEKVIPRSERLNELIELLNHNYTAVMDKDIPFEVKGALLWVTREIVADVAHERESTVAQELFDRRNSIDKGNVFRSHFVQYYLCRLAEDVCENPAGEEDGPRDYETVRAGLFEKYGETHLLDWDDAEMRKSYRELFPQGMREQIQTYDEASSERYRKVSAVFGKVAEFESKGASSVEIIASLSPEELGILRKTHKS